MAFRVLIPLCTLALSVPIAGASLIGSALVVNYNEGYDADPSWGNLQSTLAATGLSVTWLNNAQPGDLATALGSGTFDQVWYWDTTNVLKVNAADTSALQSWHASHPSIVIDARSYGVYFDFGDADETNVMVNVATQFENLGGGLWVGSDHDPLWTNNANVALADLGYNLIVGDNGNQSLSGDVGSPLLTSPHTISIASLAWGASWSIGTAPTGLQPNGATLTSVVWNSSETSHISAALVPEPVSLGMLFALALAAWRRRRS